MFIFTIYTYIHIVLFTTAFTQEYRVILLRFLNSLSMVPKPAVDWISSHVSLLCEDKVRTALLPRTSWAEIDLLTSVLHISDQPKKIWKKTLNNKYLCGKGFVLLNTIYVTTAQMVDGMYLIAKPWRKVWPKVCPDLAQVAHWLSLITQQSH